MAPAGGGPAGIPSKPSRTSVSSSQLANWPITPALAGIPRCRDAAPLERAARLVSGDNSPLRCYGLTSGHDCHWVTAPTHSPSVPSRLMTGSQLCYLDSRRYYTIAVPNPFNPVQKSVDSFAFSTTSPLPMDESCDTVAIFVEYRYTV
jgi:hypothetical protein